MTLTTICRDCTYWRGKDTRSFGRCSKIHTNASRSLIWSYPVAISGVPGYVPGDEIETTSDFGCVLWEPKLPKEAESSTPSA